MSFPRTSPLKKKNIIYENKSSSWHNSKPCHHEGSLCPPPLPRRLKLQVPKKDYFSFLTLHPVRKL